MEKNSFFHSLTAGPVKIYGQRASKTLIVWPSGPVGKFFYVEPCICVSICAPIRFLYIFRKTVYLKWSISRNETHHSVSGINNSNILLCVCLCQWTHLASCFSASAQSSSNPMSTADTSIYGSQTVKPRPIRSMAVRRMVLWGGSLGLGGCSSRKVNALPAKSGNSRNSVKYNNVWGGGAVWKQQKFDVTLRKLNLEQRNNAFHLT